MIMDGGKLCMSQMEDSLFVISTLGPRASMYLCHTWLNVGDSVIHYLARVLFDFRGSAIQAGNITKNRVIYRSSMFSKQW